MTSKICTKCGCRNYNRVFNECDICINKVCTPYEDMPQGYKDGVAIAAKKMSDNMDELVSQHILLMQDMKGNEVGKIKGREGIEIEIEVPFDFKRDYIKQIFIDRLVSINWKVYKIKGVNTFAIQEIKKGTVIGLLVEERE